MLHFAIAAGLILGLAVGLAAAATGNEWLLAVAKGSAPFGTVFINAIRMVVIPLIVTIIFVPAIIIGMSVMKLGLQFSPDITMPVRPS